MYSGYSEILWNSLWKLWFHQLYNFHNQREQKMIFNQILAQHLHQSSWSEVTCGQVWWPILWICALHLTHPSAHTQSEHKHTVNTLPEQCVHIIQIIRCFCFLHFTKWNSLFLVIKRFSMSADSSSIRILRYGEIMCTVYPNAVNSLLTN